MNYKCRIIIYNNVVCIYDGETDINNLYTFCKRIYIYLLKNKHISYIWAKVVKLLKFDRAHQIYSLMFIFLARRTYGGKNPDFSKFDNLDSVFQNTTIYLKSGFWNFDYLMLFPLMRLYSKYIFTFFFIYNYYLWVLDSGIRIFVTSLIPITNDNHCW